MLYAAISFFLIIIPLLCWGGWGDGIRFPKEVLSILGFVSIIGIGVSSYSLKPFKSKILLFWGWCFLTLSFSSYLFPVYLSKVVVQMPANFFAWKELLYSTLAIFTIYVISSASTNQERFYNFGFLKFHLNERLSFRLVSKAITIIVFLVSIYAIIQAIGFDEVFRTCDYNTGLVAQNPLTGAANQTGNIMRRVVGTLGNPSLLAIWLSICLPLCLYQRTVFGYITSTIALIVLVITGSCMAILGTTISVGIYLFFNHKKILLSLLAIFLPIFLLLSFSSNFKYRFKHFINPTGRVAVHKEAWKILAEKPMTGLGLGTFEYLIGNNPNVVERLNNENWKELHDEYGQVWFTTGLIGLSLFMIFITSTIRKFLKNITEESIALFSSLAAFLVMSVGYFTLRVAPISFYGVILTGLFLQKIGENA